MPEQSATERQCADCAPTLDQVSQKPFRTTDTQSKRISSLTLLAVVAILYFFAGRLALLLAIPPGYAAPIWPAAALALIAALVYGKRAWFGIWLGSVAVNVSHSWPETAGLAHLPVAVQLPAIIGLGAAAGAGAGAYLIRRTIGFPSDLADIRSIGLFLLLGGPVSCVLSPSIGVSTLVLSGIIPIENAAFSWMTWWVGDSLGVLLFCVVLLPFTTANHGIWSNRRRLLPAILLGTSGVMTWLFVQFSEYEVAAQNRHFQQSAEENRRHIQSEIDKHIGDLYDVAALIYSNTTVNREGFRSFCSHILQRRPGTHALSWNPLVAGDQRTGFIAQARQEGLKDFEIVDHDDDGNPYRSPLRSVYSPVYFVEPPHGNELVLGLDLYSNDTRQNTVNRAIASGHPATTPPIRRVQNQYRGDASVLIAMPVFESHERQQKAIGTVAGVFRVKDWMENPLGRTNAANLNIQLSHTPDFSERLYRSAAEDREPDAIFRATYALTVADQTWWVHFDASQAFLAASRTYVPWSLLAGGLLFASLAGVFLLMVTGERYRMQSKNNELRLLLTELENTQTELVESKRIISLGAMVSGLAHELNTPIGVGLTANSCLPAEIPKLTRNLEGGQLGRKELQRALGRWLEASQITHRSLERAADLIRTFKTVIAERANQDVQRIDLAQCIGEAVSNLELLDDPQEFAIEYQAPSEPLWIETVPLSIHQIISNLVNNAKFHGYKGETGRVSVHLAPTAGGGARISIEDAGQGIEPDALGKIFEPFFTTRRGQGGTGLGLHVVHNLIKHQLDGTIKVNSAPGEGTRFEIELPAKLA